MPTFHELLSQTTELRRQILDDIKAWRASGCRIIRNNEDITEAWLGDQQARADKLTSMIVPTEEPPLYVYGAF